MWIRTKPSNSQFLFQHRAARVVLPNPKSDFMTPQLKTPQGLLPAHSETTPQGWQGPLSPMPYHPDPLTPNSALSWGSSHMGSLLFLDLGPALVSGSFSMSSAVWSVLPHVSTWLTFSPTWSHGSDPMVLFNTSTCPSSLHATHTRFFLPIFSLLSPIIFTIFHNTHPYTIHLLIMFIVWTLLVHQGVSSTRARICFTQWRILAA